MGLFPKTGLRLVFGVENTDAAILFFARHWGVLIFAVGALLAFVAYNPGLRAPVLIAAALEKIAIVLLVLFGPLKRTPGMYAIAAGDGLFAAIYVLYLLTAAR